MAIPSLPRDDRLLSVPLKISGDRIEPGEPKVMFSLQGTSSYNGAIYWEPLATGSASWCSAPPAATIAST